MTCTKSARYNTCVASCSVSIVVTSKGKLTGPRSCLWIRLIRLPEKATTATSSTYHLLPFQDDGGRYATSRRASPRALRSMQQVAQNKWLDHSQSLGTGTMIALASDFCLLGAKSACRTDPSILLKELLWLFITKLPIYYKYRRCSMVLLTLSHSLSTTRVVVYHSSLSFALAVL
jgi:hypothetical protein